MLVDRRIGMSNDPFPRDVLDHLEQRLLEERQRALRDVGSLAENFGASTTDSDGDLTSYPLHMADQGTDTMEQEKSFLLASREGRLLWNIDEALRRLYHDPDSYGICENCGARMSAERLDAVPHARFCIDCKQLEESTPR
jgi:RNA polymerase-binding protein DksA